MPKPRPTQLHVAEARDLPDKAIGYCVAMEVKPFRIIFSVKTIGPARLPGFVYVSHRLEFDRIVYAAIVHAESPEFAMAEITNCWPDAEFRTLEQGVSSFAPEDTHIRALQFGSSIVDKKPTYLERFAEFRKRHGN